MFYGTCEYCPISGAIRERGLPFGNKDGTIVVVVPNYVRLTEDEKTDLTLACPDAYFIYFVACANVENIDSAEIACGVLLRNESRKFRKILVYESQALKDLFHIVADSVMRNDGVKLGTYKSRIGEKEFYKEYERLKNDA